MYRCHSTEPVRHVGIVCLAACFLMGGLASVATPDESSEPPVERRGTLTVRMTGFRNAAGVAQVALFRDAKGFPDNAALAFQTNSAAIVNGAAVATFKDIPWGAYAVGALHDENRNGKMETNWLGMPREGYGASNNPRSRTGAPSFDAAVFKLISSALTVSITLRY